MKTTITTPVSRRRTAKLALGVLALGMAVMTARSSYSMNLDGVCESQNVIDCRGLSIEGCNQAQADFDKWYNRAKRAAVAAYRSVFGC